MSNLNSLSKHSSTQLPIQAPTQTNTLELNDIHLPEQISGYPVAYGWWILALLIIAITAFSIKKIKAIAKQNQIKKQALLQLKNNPNMTIPDTISLLKWTAFHYFSREEFAKLFGESLQTFLSLKLPVNYRQKFNDLSKQAFLNQYQGPKECEENNQSITDLTKAAKLWLTYALPPKKQKINSKQQGDNS